MRKRNLILPGIALWTLGFAVLAVLLWRSADLPGVAAKLCFAALLTWGLGGGLIALLLFRGAMRWLSGEGAGIYLKNPAALPKPFQKQMGDIADFFAWKYNGKLAGKQIELAILQNTINPHFLYNTLDSIRGEAVMCGQPVIAEMTKCLARYFRYSIGNSIDRVTLEEEIESVKNYASIQKFRFEDRFNLSVDVQEQKTLECYVPKMILQPIVENAILHGLGEYTQGGQVVITVQAGTADLYISVRDNGCGMTPAQVEGINASLQDTEAEQVCGHGHGIALKNVSKRIALLYGPDYGIHVQSMVGCGTEVHITLPQVTYWNKGSIDPNLC